MDLDTVNITDPLERGNACWITIDNKSIEIRWEHPLPDLPHKPSRIEIMAAGALLGIARALTGKGEEDVMRAVARLDRRARK